MIRLNISNIQWIYSDFYEPNLLYGDGYVWVVKIVMYDLLHIFLHLQAEYMTL